jgi:hypothetical protein
MLAMTAEDRKRLKNSGGGGVDAEYCPLAELDPRFGISRTTGNRLIAERLIDARKLGSSVLVNVASVRRYLAGLPRPSIRTDDRSARLAAPQSATAA